MKNKLFRACFMTSAVFALAGVSSSSVLAFVRPDTCPLQGTWQYTGAAASGSALSGTLPNITLDKATAGGYVTIATNARNAPGNFMEVLDGTCPPGDATIEFHPGSPPTSPNIAYFFLGVIQQNQMGVTPFTTSSCEFTLKEAGGSGRSVTVHFTDRGI